MLIRLLVLLFVLSPVCVAAQSPLRVLLVPFETDHAPEYSYLADPIKNMLASRLAVRFGVEPVVEGRVSDLLDGTGQIIPGRLQGLLSQHQADYLLLGRLAGKRGELSADVMLLSLTETAVAPRQYSIKPGEVAGLSAAVDGLVEDMGRDVLAPGKAIASQSGGAQEPVAQKKLRSPHPERTMRQGIFGVQSNLEGVEGMVPEALETRRSGLLAVQVQAMDVADLDGDGLDEVILASHGQVQVYQERDGIFSLLSRSSLPVGLRVHALNAADLDRNGQAELYVSATQEEQPSSVILVWEESELLVRSASIPWYLRPVRIPGEGGQLLGQQAGVDTLLEPGVSRLASGPSGLTPDAPIFLPRGLNLFDFIHADLTGDGASEIIGVDHAERLVVYGAAGRLLWAGGEDFGGSSRFLGVPPVVYQGRGDDELANRELIYVPVRLTTVDLDQDGSMEILAVRNKRLASQFMKRFRFYQEGHVAVLDWRENGLQTLWRTTQGNSQVIDFQVSAANGAKNKIHLVQEMEQGPLASLFDGPGRAVLTTIEFSPLGPGATSSGATTTK